MRRRACVATLGIVGAIAAFGPAAASAEIRFQPAQDHPAAMVSSGLGAGAIASADFDGDGRPDLVVSNCFGGGPSVLLGGGDGSFAAPRVQRIGIDACTVGTGDFDADGNADLVVGSYQERVLRVLLGRGDGTFSSPSATHRTPAQPQQVAIADLDRDTRLDIAAVSDTPGDVTILLGKGDGSFDPMGQVPVGAGYGASIASGDFNADGVPDLVVSDAAKGLQGEAEVLLGLGDGTFAPKVGYAVGFAPEFIAAGDLDGDGRLDLVTNNAFSSDLSLLFGRGDGTFRPELRIRNGEEHGLAPVGVDATNGGAGVTLADFDADGRLDIAATHAVFSGISILAGAGGGRFTPAGDYRVAGFPEPALAADLDGDGRPDLAVPGNVPAIPGSGDLTTRVSVLLNASPPPAAGAPRTERARLRLRVTPSRAAARGRIAFRLRVSAVIGGRQTRIPGATVRIAGRTAVTNGRGQAAIVLRPRRPRLLHARATKEGFLAGSAAVRIVAPRSR